MTEVPIMQKPVPWFAVQINGLVSIWRDLRYERAKPYDLRDTHLASAILTKYT